MANDLRLGMEMRGVNRVRNQLRTAAAAHPDVSDPVLEKHAKSERLRLKTKPYPPRLPGQVYVRTGRTANSFRAIRIQRGAWAVFNTAPRRKYVIGKTSQATIHKGRWYVLADELQRGMRRLTTALSRELEKVLDRVR